MALWRYTTDCRRWNPSLPFLHPPFPLIFLSPLSEQLYWQFMVTALAIFLPAPISFSLCRGPAAYIFFWLALLHTKATFTPRLNTSERHFDNSILRIKQRTFE